MTKEVQQSCDYFCVQIVSPFDARVVPVEGSADEVMIYPTEADMNDYEVILTFVMPIQEVLNHTHGLLADAGVVIGEATKSPCQPNFIHVSIRKLNSTVEVNDLKKQICKHCESLFHVDAINHFIRCISCPICYCLIHLFYFVFEKLLL